MAVVSLIAGILSTAAPLVGAAALPICAAALLMGCQKPSEKAAANVPAGLRVEVQVDGKASAAIDSALLNATSPDYRDDERPAWRLSSLLKNVYNNKQHSVLLQDSAGGSVSLAQAGAKDGKVVVVALTRAGTLRVARIAAKDPFPKFHGRGGHRGRRGDPARVKDVARIMLLSKARPAVNDQPQLTLSVTLNGKAQTWSDAQLRSVVSKEFAPGDKDGKRLAWSLRELAEKLAGAGVRVVSVTGEGQREVALAQADWSNAERVPLLRLNRRGQLKFLWVGAADLSPIDGEEALRRVSAVKLVKEAAPSPAP